MKDKRICHYNLKDFILQHWQLVGIPRDKAVANFGIFGCLRDPIVGPVETHGVKVLYFVISHVEKHQKINKKYVEDLITYPFKGLEGWVL